MSRVTAVVVLGLAAAGCAPGIRDVPASANVDIPGATFSMGTTTVCRDNACGGDKLPHSVTVKSFQIAATEVSLLQYSWCVGMGKCAPADTTWDYDLRNRPIAVDIAKARRYCAAQGGRLPTEAEWELAARSTRTPTMQSYPWGDAAVGCDKVVSGDCPAGELTDVGSNAVDVTPLGVHDLGGNLPEWVDDDYTPAAACVAETPLETVCNGDPACAAQRCARASMGCQVGCALAVPVRSGATFCELSTDVVVDPLRRVSMSLPLFKGGGAALPACASEAASRSAYDLRPLTARPPVGFRCAFDPRRQAAPAPRATERIRIPVQFDCATLTLAPMVGATLSSDDAARLAVSLETEGQHVPATSGGGTLSFACTGMPLSALLVIRDAPLANFAVKVSFNDQNGNCRAAVVPVELTGGELAFAVARDNVTFTDCTLP